MSREGIKAVVVIIVSCVYCWKDDHSISKTKINPIKQEKMRIPEESFCVFQPLIKVKQVLTVILIILVCIWI